MEIVSRLKKNKKWLRIKIKEDNYTGYVINKKFSQYIKSSHKVAVLKAKENFLINAKRCLTFGSKIKVLDKKKFS